MSGMSTDQKPLKPGGFADRALQHIAANPGATFLEIHNHLRPHARTFQGTSRDTDRLVFAGLIRKERDGKCVRHYPADISAV